MKKIKREFFEKGVDNQTTPSIVFDLRRVDNKKIGEWTTQQKQAAKEFIEQCETSFKIFKKELTKSFKCLK